MKSAVFCLGLLLAGAACAAPGGELGEANALFASKSYPQALQLYTRLAESGNPEAQRHLGQMYWYGEAGAIDLARADAWFRKSAAKGNKTAIAALGVMKERERRRADIDHWTSKYDGADLVSGQFRCPAPRLPALSKTNEEIARVSARVAAWQACYNKAAKNLNAASPLVGRIPAEIAKLLNKEELDRATVHLGQVEANLTADARISAKMVLADVAAWRSATESYVSEHNAIVNGAPSADRQGDAEARRNNYAPAK